MALKMQVKVQGLIDPRQFRAWERDWKRRQREQVAKGMGEWGRQVAAKIGVAAQSALKLSGKKVPRSFKARVYDSKKDRLPAVRIYSRIPWMGLHTEGGAVSSVGKKLLIPLLAKRMGPKAFKAIVDRIMQTGSGFFKQVGSNVILFAEYQPEYGRPLARFRREYRTATGQKRVRAGTDIPIAVLVKGVTLRKRLDFNGIVESSLGGLAEAIERRLEL